MISGLEENKVYLAQNPLMVQVGHDQQFIHRLDLYIFNRSKINHFASHPIRINGLKGLTMRIDLSPYVKILFKDLDGRDAREDEENIPHTLNHFSFHFQINQSGNGQHIMEKRDYYFLNAGISSDQINVEAPKELYVNAPFYLYDNTPMGLGTFYNVLEGQKIVTVDREKESTPIKNYKHHQLDYSLKVRFVNRYGGYSFLGFEALEEKTDSTEYERINMFYDFERKKIYPKMRIPKLKKTFTARVELESQYHDLLQDLISSAYVINEDNKKRLILQSNSITKTNAETVEFQLQFEYVNQHQLN